MFDSNTFNDSLKLWQASDGDIGLRAIAVIGMSATIGDAGLGFGKNIGRNLVRHSDLIKDIVRKASKPGVLLSNEQINQLKRIVEKAGGRLRTEVGKTGSVKGVLHSQVEGFGSKIEHRHIIHLEQ